MDCRPLAAVSTLIALFLTIGSTSYAEQDEGAPFLRGGAEATFGRLTLEAGPPLSAETQMTTILSLRGFGDVLVFCYLNVGGTPDTAGGFAFRNTTSKPVVVSGFGTLQPGERTFGSEGAIGIMTSVNVFQVASDFDHPDRIATVTVSGYVDGHLCRGHAHAIAQR